jgi:hypothetical protein
MHVDMVLKSRHGQQVQTTSFCNEARGQMARVIFHPYGFAAPTQWLLMDCPNQRRQPLFPAREAHMFGQFETVTSMRMILPGKSE